MEHTGKVLKEYKATRIMEPAHYDVHHKQRVYIEDQDGTGWTEFEFLSVVGSCRLKDEDPTASLEKAKKYGHELYSLWRTTTVIHAGPKEEQQTRIGLQFGDIVTFEGKKFEIAYYDFDNCSLYEL